MITTNFDVSDLIEKRLLKTKGFGLYPCIIYVDMFMEQIYGQTTQCR